jgi:TonB-dependent receptor
MNTIDLSSRVRLIVGLRLEATHVDTLSFDSSQDPGTLTAKAGGDYVDALPSASLRIGITKNSGIRLVYGQGISRPDPQYLSSVVSFNPDTDAYSIGNPGLKPEHANNFDVLYEQYLNPLGMIQAGFFYKSLSDPIVTSQTHPSTGPYGGFDVNQPNNGGSAWVTGFEVAFQQHFSYLPGALNGLGVAANYSYTASQASGLDGRTDKPALLRQAPHTWNISPTYDKWRVSARLGLSYNAASIFAYQWTDGLSPLGVKGPSGDNYLYPHMQVDAQATFRIIRNLQAVVYGLNLTNEVFGFYNGSPQYVVQREYYKPTYAGGLKYTFSREK